MLIRIGLIIAIIGALLAGVVNFVVIKDKVTALQAHDKQESDAHIKFEGDYRRTKSDLDKTNAVLKTTIETLNATQEAKDKAVAEAEAQTKRATKLAEDLSKTQGERDDAQRELAAYRATGLPPDQIKVINDQNKSLVKNVAGLEGENKVLGQKIKKLANELAKYDPNPPPVTLPATLKGKVVGYDPKYQFVILNVGQDQGVLERGELLLNRGGRLVAKVKVSSVDKDHCVANIIPGWKVGEVIEGDAAIPAFPES
jgi:hypothetical protein